MARQKRSFTASHKSLYAEASTKAEASAKLEAAIDWALEDRPLHIECRFGWVIIIAASANGYASKLLDPADLEHDIKYHAGCFHGQIDFAPLLQSCRSHAAQNAWTPATETEAHIEASGLDKANTAELRSWIAWQKRYADARASGANDGEAHHLACMAA